MILLITCLINAKNNKAKKNFVKNVAMSITERINSMGGYVNYHRYNKNKIIHHISRLYNCSLGTAKRVYGEIRIVEADAADIFY